MLDMNKIETNQLDRIKLLDLFAEAWRKLDAEIIIPYLASDFEYSSYWVFSSLDYYGYIDYIRGKFEAIRKANSQVVVEKGYNELGESAVVLTQDGKQRVYLTIEVKDSKIKRADLMPF